MRSVERVRAQRILRARARANESEHSGGRKTQADKQRADVSRLDLDMANPRRGGHV